MLTVKVNSNYYYINQPSKDSNIVSNEMDDRPFMTEEMAVLIESCTKIVEIDSIERVDLRGG